MNTTTKKTGTSNEIKCPNCGERIVLDKNAYASIAQQVRDAEFVKSMHEAQNRLDRELAAMQSVHKAELSALAAQKDAEINEVRADAETQIEAFCSSVDIAEEKAKSALAIAKQERDAAIAQVKSEKEAALHEANERLKAAQVIAAHDKAAAVAEAQAQTAQLYSNRIAKLEAQVRSADAECRLALSTAQQNSQKELSAKENELAELRHQLEQQSAEHSLALEAKAREHELTLRQKEEEIAFYKDFKLRQSTKMLGESLEQHCLTAFNQVRAMGFPRAYFDKDNDASSGSKGDFIFRDFDERGIEYISIMFEMKNEADYTDRKHKNEEFFKKLDADRKTKGCEYAVLVSTLEADSEFYNIGIVDVSHRFPKMYVIRPGFFIPMLSILRNAAANSCEYREEVEMLRDQHFDVQQFVSKLSDFKDSFSKSYTSANKHLEAAIAEIDKTIGRLEKTKKELQSSAKQLESASSKAESATLKKLTRGNPTMKKKFRDAGVAIEGSEVNVPRLTDTVSA